MISTLAPEPAGLSFSINDIGITLDAESGGTSTTLSTSLKDLQKLGVDNVLLNGGTDGDVNLQLGSDLAALSGVGLPGFASTLNVSLQADSADLQDILATSGLASALHTSGIDEINLYGDAYNLSAAELTEMTGGTPGTTDDLVFSENDFITLTVTDADLQTVADNALGADHIGVDELTANGASLTLNESQVTDFVSAGLQFSGDDTNITLDVDAAGTHLTNSLKDLQKLGVDNVLLDGGSTGNITIGLGSGDPLGVGGLPSFGDLNVSLGLTDQSQLDEILGESGLAFALQDHGIDELDMAGDIATIDLFGAEQMMGAMGQGMDLTFAAEDIVTLTADQDTVSYAAAAAQSLVDLGVDYLSSSGGLVIGDNDAAALAATTLTFDGAGTITVDVQNDGTGTTLSSSLKDLQKLGVDAVMLNGGKGGALGIGLGSVGTLDGMGLPAFDGDLDVSLLLNGQDQLDEIVDSIGLGDALSGSGIDTLDMLDDTASIDLQQAQELMGFNGSVGDELSFGTDDNVTLSVDIGSLAGVVGQADELSALGVDYLDAGGALTIGDSDAIGIQH